MNQKILIIDDDPDQRLSVRLPLEANGYEICEASGVAEARGMIEEVKPDLILLDVMMETTTAGFQLALDLHNQDAESGFKDFKQIPIIMLTAIHSTTPLRFGPDEDFLPVQVFLDKPVDSKLLIQTVGRLLGKTG